MSNGVSVVITTVNRIVELRRALESVKCQNYEDIEVIVVVDGGNLETLNFLKKYSKIKVISNVPNVGGAESRNIGIRAATKRWVALLDDDDEWLEGKVQAQVDILSKFSKKEDVVSFTSLYTYINNPSHSFSLPRENYSPNKNVGDYLFTLKKGKWNGWIQTSTIMAPKKTFLEVAFNPLCPKHQDWDWILNVQNRDIPIIHVEKPLTIYHKKQNVNSVSQTPNWEFSERWIKDQKKYISKKAYEHFIISVVNNGISKDRKLTIRNRNKEISKRMRKLQLSTRASVATGRFSLQYLYNMTMNRTYD